MFTILAWLVVLAAVAVVSACVSSGNGADDEATYTRHREAMVREQLQARDIVDPLVLSAMRKVQRHLFVPPDLRAAAYQDSPLPIGLDQTISQPYIVAFMTQQAGAGPKKKALDVGTGSGYQAAVLAETCGTVFSIEILCDLATAATKRLTDLGYRNVEVRCGDGYAGWPEAAPFDVIIVAAAPRAVPEALVDQLAPGGRLVIPVGGLHQELIVVEKDEDGSVHRSSAGGVRFVPMTGEAQNKP
jgi:protein-L-isoaspartate(D-aspartate) O-methyltransferase